MTPNYKEILLKYKSIVALIIFSIIISLINSRFLTIPNILNILRQTSINSIIAAGMTFVILSGGIDLSVGSILAISGAIVAYLISSGTNIIVAIISAIAIGAAVGIVNGIIISKGRVQPFIATLAMMTLLRGYTLVFTDGKPISIGELPVSQMFSTIGAGRFLGTPIPVYITILVFVISYYVLRQTPFGRYVYAQGGNEEATKLSGIDVDRVKIYVYGISGILSAVAGIIITSRLASAQPQAGAGYELDAIAAVVLGGTSLMGGYGSILGTIVGALIIGILNNALNLLDVSSYYQLLAKGFVILIAVLLDRKENK